MSKDRKNAGTQLAQRSLNHKNQDVVVLSIPEGGLPLGAIVAEALNASLEVVFPKKNGHPTNKEHAIGKASFGHKCMADSMDATLTYIEEESRRIRGILRQRQDQYHKEPKPMDLKDKVVVIVNDGMAGISTILAIVGLIEEEEPLKIKVAVPVTSSSALEKLNESPFVDEVVCLHIPNYLQAVG